MRHLVLRALYHIRRRLMNSRANQIRSRIRYSLMVLAHSIPHLPVTRDRVIVAIEDMRNAIGELQSIDDVPQVSVRACEAAIRTAETTLALSDSEVKERQGGSWN